MGCDILVISRFNTVHVSFDDSVVWNLFLKAMERDKKQWELQQQTPCVADLPGTNDLDYEDKRKTRDSNLVFEGLHFNLAAENSK